MYHIVAKTSDRETRIVWASEPIETKGRAKRYISHINKGLRAGIYCRTLRYSIQTGNPTFNPPTSRSI